VVRGRHADEGISELAPRNVRFYTLPSRSTLAPFSAWGEGMALVALIAMVTAVTAGVFAFEIGKRYLRLPRFLNFPGALLAACTGLALIAWIGQASGVLPAQSQLPEIPWAYVGTYGAVSILWYILVLAGYSVARRLRQPK
jgi:hypothetical protein